MGVESGKYVWCHCFDRIVYYLEGNILSNLPGLVLLWQSSYIQKLRWPTLFSEDKIERKHHFSETKVPYHLSNIYLPVLYIIHATFKNRKIFALFATLEWNRVFRRVLNGDFNLNGEGFLAAAGHFARPINSELRDETENFAFCWRYNRRWPLSFKLRLYRWWNGLLWRNERGNFLYCDVRLQYFIGDVSSADRLKYLLDVIGTYIQCTASLRNYSRDMETVALHI